ncbi:glycosyltransferase [Vibrio cyclitrophicus]|uniref:glycosyltransferase n=1 Tax=Vibrio cyclitrophicus TaxID=47951 RepID=UPI003999656F
MKILACTGERFFRDGSFFTSKQTSVAFVQEVFGQENVDVAAAIDDEDCPAGCSSKVLSERFLVLPKYNSTKDFIKKSILKRGFFKEYLQTLDAIIKSRNYDAIWIRTPSVGNIIVGLVAMRSGCKIINHVCADASRTWKDNKYSTLEKIFGLLSSRLILLLLRRICRNVDTVNLTTGSELELFSKKVSPEKTYQFVDMMISKPTNVITANPVRKSVGEKIELLFIGRVVRDKGVFELVDAVSNNNNAILNIVGDGPDFQELKEYSSQSTICGKVNLFGQISHHKLGHYLKSSDAVCVPSNNHYEGFPRVIMESWSYLKPVIVSDVGGVRAFVEDDVNGLIITPGSTKEISDAILKLSTPDVYEKLISGVLEVSDKSSKEYWVNRTREIIYES